MAAQRDELIAELTALVLPEERARRMLVPMTKVRLLGARREVERVVDELHQLGLVEIADARGSLAVEELAGDEDRSTRRERAPPPRRADERAADLIAGAATRRDAAQDPLGRPLDLAALEAELEPISRGVEASAGAGCRAPRRAARAPPGYLEPLRRLLPLVPELADLDDEELAPAPAGHRSRSSSTPTTSSVLELLRDELAEELGARFELVWTRIEEGAMGLPGRLSRSRTVARCTRCSGSAQVRQAALPDAFKRLSLRAAVEAMQRRLAALPELIDAVDGEREALLRPHVDAARRPARGRSPTSSSGLTRSTDFGATQRTFVAECWVPRGEPRAAATRARRHGSAPPCSSRTCATSPRDPQAPLLMHNSRAGPAVRAARAASSSCRAPARSIRRC